MLSVDHKNRICLITIDRPPVNALNHTLLEELIADFKEAGQKSDHGIILTGTAARFCPGLDTKILTGKDEKEKARLMSLLSELLKVVTYCPVPVVAAINGHCLGGGAVLAALCDYRVMEKGEFKIGVPEVKLGVHLPKHVHNLLARLTGNHFAARLCQEGLLLEPGAALDSGLVDELVKKNKAKKAARRWCKTILSLPRETMLAMRMEYRQDIHAIYSETQEGENTNMIKAIVVDKVDDKAVAVYKDIDEAELPDEDVLVEIDYSSLNYKDGLALSGGPICRKTPMVAGIDLAATVLESRSKDWQVGDKVLVNGWGLSEVHWGGYSQKQRLKPDWLVKLPDAFSPEQAMAIGTAGYTAMLCVMALQDQGVVADKGPVLVTGAGGGVGSVAIALLSKLGYEVVASTGRSDIHDYLRELGASEFIDRSDLSSPGKPFQKEHWSGVVDSVGGATLANALAQCQYNASVAACGLAGGNDLPTTVLPFILRGVKLIGIDSVMAPRETRERAWTRLAEDLDPDKLAKMTSTVPMSGLIAMAKDIIAGKVRGRIVVDVNK